MKKSSIFILLFFLYACGYTSVYKNVIKQDLNINVISLDGNLEINNLIKNQIELFSNDESKNIFNIDIKTSYEKIVIAKDAKGIATNYKLDGIFNFKIYFKDNEYSMNIKESFNIQKNSNSYEQTSYEKIIKENFVKSAVDKLTIKLININDN
tara:strand:+ start:329 stop:787 length:459 start_codon:yes stop_codon:yes gene_type:complete